MTGVSFRVAAFTAAALLLTGAAHALSFDERWKSMYDEGGAVSGDKVSAKAEMLPQAERPRRSERPRTHRGRAGARASRRGERLERSREWYKGGKKWHYVYTKRRRG